MENRVVGGIVSLVVALGLYWVTYGSGPVDPPASPSSAPVESADAPPPRATLTPVVQPVTPEPVDVPMSSEPTPADPSWAPLHGRVRTVLSEELVVDVPPGATRYEAFDAKLDAVDARTTELDALIVELTELAESSPDPLTRVDALTSLGETYQALAESIAQTPVPDWERPRAQRRQRNDLNQRQAIAEDKARMVFQTAQHEVGATSVPLGTDLSRRLSVGLESSRLD